MNIFLSKDIRDLMIAEILEHEDECGQYTVQELASIEQYYGCMTDPKLFSEYQNYFGVCVGETDPWQAY